MTDGEIFTSFSFINGMKTIDFLELFDIFSHRILKENAIRMQTIEKYQTSPSYRRSVDNKVPYTDVD